MQTVSPQFLAFVKSQIKTPAVYIKVQLPSADGSRVNSQFILANVTSLVFSKRDDAQSDTVGFTIPDNSGIYSPLNPSSQYGAGFTPGVIDNKFLVYLGFRSL